MASYYVSPSGNSSNNGSIGAPLDLATAIGASSPAGPGDTIWLRGGTYVGAFTSELTGTSGAPIIVRQFSGERAIVDSASAGFVIDALTVNDGEYVWFWGFEIMSSATERISLDSGPFPDDLHRGYAVTVHAPNIRLINLIAHDNLFGFGIWSEAPDSIAYGNLIYYNGWQAPDDGHGHGIYTQNQTGARLCENNILFDQFSHGIHAYGSGAAYLDSITLRKNISFMNGSISTGGIYVSGRDLLLGGGRSATNPVVDQNAIYRGNTNLGYIAGCTGAQLTGNYIAGAMQLVATSPTVTGNNFWDLNWPNYGTWPTDYPSNTYHTTEPTGTVVRVYPNTYEPGRSHVVVYNWDENASVSVDLSGTGLGVGTSYEIRDVQNYFGTPVAVGTYAGGSVSVPMTGTTKTTAVGNVPVAAVHTPTEFGAFIVLPTDAAYGARLIIGPA